MEVNVALKTLMMENRICRRKRRHNQSSTCSIRKDSIFSHSRVTLTDWLTLIYRFAQGLQLRQVDMMEDGIAKSSRTLTRMTKILRKVCNKALRRFKRRKGFEIGSRSLWRFVVIDESKFSQKRKYNRGRIGPTWRREGWVFGMLEVKHNRRRPILKMVKDRSQETLIPIIRRHVRRGSTILSDCWRAYVRSLNRLGYNHQTVNHTNNFVDPQSGYHTQHIERAWQTIKGAGLETKG
ncbi:uncharacterized protein LOC105030231 isoform X2 [Esox lucius]|uniref:uncharacterized protein LOC105030231 isoform X2 n=1 Tax=Esox lucius TaxID=8010 RepID=UPI0010BD3B45|nr:uncharacterized protein LOC105030231 isoform X2 [Esox lucius]